MTAAGAIMPRGVARFAPTGAAVLDQLLFAASGFLVNVLLARWLAPADYGAFTVAFVIFLLLGSLHTAVLTEPMLVYGAGRYRRGLPAYLRVLVGAHAALTLGFSAALAVAALVARAAGSDAVAGALAGLALGVPGLLLLWLARRVFYITRQPLRAAAGSAVSLAATLIALVVLRDELSPGVAFALMGASALVAGVPLVWLAARLPQSEDARPSASGALADHWRYGRFSVVAQALSWSSGQIILVLIPLVLGLTEAAAVGAVLNLFRPLHPLQQSVVALLLPSTAALAEGGATGTALRAHVRRALVPFAAGTFAYGVLLALVAGPLMHHLYGGRYDGRALLVFLVGCVYTASTVVQTATVVLKATGNVRYVPLVWGASAAFTVVFAVPAMLVAGVEGALAVFALSYVGAALLAARRTRQAVPA